ncbi:hypothetical protein A4S05_16160 [Nostoc sp. KVJ20]|uniref:hypothetical protein n=1 Tax=Nostoc sp. KVJ20 TaxID=457944 RepID=UPI00083DE58D|nr:hypothetical protein [Nostoc sp. KVJ20]ODG96800.1 hypothetical protein A4S05_16160 [Nostoc sp. KVJ20]
MLIRTVVRCATPRLEALVALYPKCFEKGDRTPNYFAKFKKRSPHAKGASLSTDVACSEDCQPILAGFWGIGFGVRGKKKPLTFTL